MNRIKKILYLTLIPFLIADFWYEWSHYIQPSEPLISVSDTVANPSAPAAYTGDILDGESASKVVEYNQHDYELATRTGALIVLYFYSGQNCDTCDGELGQMKVGFSELNAADVVGFRVHYTDSGATPEADALAARFGVSAPATKVIVKDGTAVAKASDWWNEDAFEEHIKAVK